MTSLKRCSTYSLPRFFHPVATRRRHRNLRNRGLPCISLIFLMLLLLNAQAATAIADAQFMAVGGEPASQWHSPISRYNNFMPSPLHFRAAGRLPTGNGGSSLTIVSKGVVLFDEVQQTAAGFEHICMIDIDLDNPNVRLGLAQAHDHLMGPDEPLSAMANRTKALAGINGDYFEIGGPGRPIGMAVSNGRLLQSPTNDSFYAVMGVTSHGRLTIGPEFFSGSIIDGTASYPLHELNIYSDIHKGLILITPDLGAGISVAGDTVAMLQPVANVPDTFTVQSVQSDTTWLPALSGQDAIIGRTEAGHWLASHLHPHDQLRVTEQISPDGNLIQAIGGGPVVLKDGRLYYDPHPPVPGEVSVRNPITAIGVSKDGTHALLAVFDGRRAGPWRSVGMTYGEAGDYMRAHGAYNAMLFDTGGSSELVTRLPGQKAVSIINSPSGGKERPVANGLFVYETGITNTTTIPCKICKDDTPSDEK